MTLIQSDNMFLVVPLPANPHTPIYGVNAIYFWIIKFCGSMVCDTRTSIFLALLLYTKIKFTIFYIKQYLWTYVQTFILDKSKIKDGQSIRDMLFKFDML